MCPIWALRRAALPTQGTGAVGGAVTPPTAGRASASGDTNHSPLSSINPPCRSAAVRITVCAALAREFPRNRPAQSRERSPGSESGEGSCVCGASARPGHALRRSGGMTRSEPWAGASLTVTRGKAAGSAVTPPTATLTILRNRGATTDQTGGSTSLFGLTALGRRERKGVSARRATRWYHARR